MEQELTQEQLKSQEIVATAGTMGWQYLVEGLEAKIKELEDAIHDISIDDIPKYSERTLIIAQVNCLRTFVTQPERTLDSLRSFQK